jgi:hypothetical protein
MPNISMKPLIVAVVFTTMTAGAELLKSVHVVDIKSADGTILKGSYFAAAKPFP